MPKAKPAPDSAAAQLARYDRLIDTQPGLRRKGATMPYTSVHGPMFSFLAAPGTLAMRLPSGEREAFLERFATTLHEAAQKPKPTRRKG